MQPIRWTLGNTIAFVTPRAVLVCPATTAQGIDSVMNQVKQAQNLDDLLNCSVLTGTAGIDFAAVFWTDTRAQLALRGRVGVEMKAADQQREIQGSEDVEHHEFGDVQYLKVRLLKAQTIPGMPPLPVSTAVVPAAAVEFGNPVLEPSAVTGAGKVTPPAEVAGQGGPETEDTGGQDDGEAAAVSLEPEVSPVPPSAPEETSDSAGNQSTQAEEEASPEAASKPQEFATVEMNDGRRMEVSSALVFGRMPTLPDEMKHLEAEMVIVRSPMALVSRTHCMINPADGGLQVVDLGSNNGTYLHREGLGSVELEPNNPIPLQNGDLIDLGEDVTIRITGL